MALANEKVDALMAFTKRNAVDYALIYGEFMYKIGSCAVTVCCFQISALISSLVR